MIYTHIQSMMQIVSRYRVSTVIEFGSGDVSTKFFLDKDKCPDVTKLVSIETQPEWADRMRGLINDSRWDLIMAKSNDEARAALSNIVPQLVLIDSVTADDRVIQARMFKDANVPFIVLHDSDRCQIYRDQIYPMYRYNYTVEITDNNPIDKQSGWLSIPSTTVFSNIIQLEDIFK